MYRHAWEEHLNPCLGNAHEISDENTTCCHRPGSVWWGRIHPSWRLKLRKQPIRGPSNDLPVAGFNVGEEMGMFLFAFHALKATCLSLAAAQTEASMSWVSRGGEEGQAIFEENRLLLGGVICNALHAGP
jgi:hypothetical protein